MMACWSPFSATEVRASTAACLTCQSPCSRRTLTAVMALRSPFSATLAITSTADRLTSQSSSSRQALTAAMTRWSPFSTMLPRVSNAACLMPHCPSSRRALNAEMICWSAVSTRVVPSALTAASLTCPSPSSRQEVTAEMAAGPALIPSSLRSCNACVCLERTPLCNLSRTTSSDTTTWKDMDSSASEARISLSSSTTSPSSNFWHTSGICHLLAIIDFSVETVLSGSMSTSSNSPASSRKATLII
mmetsp:Transcript_116034/g.248070  ORF Transcript_116034/g.248070 Transcript_116034/m.248070 type:complete len:246 (+) Transcript_116034:1267-2004(+)